MYAKTHIGIFRDDEREGRGEEYEDGQLAYKGEFLQGKRHGFGIAFFAEGHRFIGKFINDEMEGVGVYCHPNGDRFEGYFHKNKPEGIGSYYKAISKPSKSYKPSLSQASKGPHSANIAINSRFSPHDSSDEISGVKGMVARSVKSFEGVREGREDLGDISVANESPGTVC